MRVPPQSAARHLRVQHRIPDRLPRLIASLLLLAFSAGTSTAAAQQSQPNVPTIQTTGEAVVRRAPDRAVLTVAVETRAQNPRDAQRQNAETMSAVQQRMAALGIPKDSTRTVGYTVQQEFDFPNGKRVPRGYLARNALEVRVDTIDRTGEMMDAAVQAGATSVSGVRFELKDAAAAEREALRLAITDARSRAEAAAAAVNATIDRVWRIEESRQVNAIPRPMMMARADQAPDTPIEPGTVEIRAQVTLVVSIK